jgi:nitrogen fixation protein FixH
MNWGKGLALALIAFAGMMAWFAIQASKNPEALVTEDYYAAELRYQQRIEEQQRAQTLSAPVTLDLTRTSVQIALPQEMRGRAVSGTLTLRRPNDPRADRTIELPMNDSAAYTITELRLLPGRYDALVEWRADNITYYMEEKVHVP